MSLGKKRVLLAGLIAAFAAAVALTAPASASSVTVICTGVSPFSGPAITTMNANLELDGEGWCRLPPGNVINGNVRVTEKARFFVQGTINGNVEADTEHEFPDGPIPDPFTPGNAILMSGSGAIDGNVVQEGSGTLQLSGTVDGNVEINGTGMLKIGAISGNANLTGNVSHKGRGCVLVFTSNGLSVSINGNVASIGGGVVWLEPLAANVLQPECTVEVFPTDPGGPITIDGNTCGVVIDPENLGGVTVTGNVSANC